jgi:hypothetical protein
MKFKIPKKFKIANNWITVNIVDSIQDSKYGTYNDVKQLITIAKTVEIDDEVVQLTEEQILNTFMHELTHCMQFYFDNNITEAQAQVYANFLCEFLNTKIDE